MSSWYFLFISYAIELLLCTREFVHMQLLSTTLKGVVTNGGREGRRATKKGEGGGASAVLPLRKKRGGAEFILAMTKGGTKSCGVVLTRELEV